MFNIRESSYSLTGKILVLNSDISLKKVFTIFLFLTFCALTAFLENFSEVAQHNPDKNINKYKNDKVVENGFTSTARYNLTVDFSLEEKIINVKEEIIWRNLTEYSTNELWFHLYANGYKSNNTLLSQRYPVNEETSTEVQISSFKINSDERELTFVNNEKDFPNDSTVAKIVLEKRIEKGDSVLISFNYSMRIPKSIKRLGYASGREFYFVSQWYPKLGVFENGEWICSPYYSNTNFYSDFADYNVTLNLPKKYKIASTGLEVSDVTKNNITQHEMVQFGVQDFVWMATDEIEEYEEIINREDSSTFVLKLFLQPENKEYAKRYIEAIKNSINYCEKHFGPYPYKTLSCVDVPRTSNSGAMEYPALFTVRTELFPREITLSLESLAVHEFVHQYFQGIVANNEVYEAWLDEGITSYVTSKILSEYYGTPYVTFKFLDFLSIEGINFLSYSEIPLIYTLGDYEHPEGYRSYYNYYRCNNIGAIADSSFKLPTVASYYVNSYYKPELMLLSLENIVGKRNLLAAISKYYSTYKFKHPLAKNFIDVIKNSTQQDLDWFFKSCYEDDAAFDYAISGITKIKENEYEVVAERLRDGIFQNDVALYTTSDTLYTHWNGKERWKKFIFTTDNEVIGAEIDPFHKNRFDLNFANNSYTVDKRFWASFSFSLRWFFWIQNALLILGSIG